MSLQQKALGPAMLLLAVSVFASDGAKKKRKTLRAAVETTGSMLSRKTRGGAAILGLRMCAGCTHFFTRPDGLLQKSLAGKKADPHKIKPPRRKTYLRHVFGGPKPELLSGAGAGIMQARGVPQEWGGGIAGYVRRFGSAFGKHIVKSSIQYSVARLRHEELGYQPSCTERFKTRLRYALLRTVITRKTMTGDRTVSTSEISAVLTSGLISRLWQPPSLQTVGSGFGSAGISLAADAGFNVVKEFWPEIRHPRTRDRELRAACAGDGL